MFTFLGEAGPMFTFLGEAFTFFDPARRRGSEAGAFTTHILGRGEPDVPPEIRAFSERRLGESDLQESSCVHVGVELVHDNDLSVTPTRDEFTQNLRPLPTTPQLWAARQKTLSLEDMKLRQCELGELCRLATVSAPDICARLACIASRVNSRQGSDAYCINDLVKSVKVRQEATVS